MKLKSILIVLIASSAIVIFSLILSLYFLGLESTLFLLIFNFLFISFTFWMNGMIRRRLGLLILGNTVALLWGLILSLTADFGYSMLGEEFAIFFRIIFPFLNSIWIISLWSWCLSAFPKHEGRPFRENSGL